MSERGVFAVDRGIFDHSVFAREPFTQCEAWIWLIAEAAYKPRTKRSDGKIINTFGSKEYGTIIRKLAEGVYLCMVDELDLVVHEPRLAWVGKAKS